MFLRKSAPRAGLICLKTMGPDLLTASRSLHASCDSRADVCGKKRECKDEECRQSVAANAGIRHARGRAGTCASSGAGTRRSGYGYRTRGSSRPGRGETCAVNGRRNGGGGDGERDRASHWGSYGNAAHEREAQCGIRRYDCRHEKRSEERRGGEEG